MKIFPAIDLMDGACVRLHQGAFSEKTIYADDPVAMARRFQAQGAEWLHVVDLDGAREARPMQTEILESLAKDTKLEIQVGGGIHRAEHIRHLLDAGVSRVVVGSRAVLAPEEVSGWLDQFGSERIACAFDVHLVDGTPIPSTRGWQDRGTRSLWDILAGYRGAGLRHVLCTDIDRDGTLQGPNLELYRDLLKREPELSLLASGGVSSLEDLAALKALPVDGAIVGKALYEEKFTLSEALSC